MHPYEIGCKTVSDVAELEGSASGSGVPVRSNDGPSQAEE